MVDKIMCLVSFLSYEQLQHFSSLPSAVSAPTQLEVTSIDATSLTLTWMEPEMPNGIITDYQVL